jgi:hypothetical protein
MHLTWLCILILFGSTSCGLPGAARESWTLVQILTTGERTETRTERVTVRNCRVPEFKTVECSAGTADNFSLQLGGTMGLNAGGELTFDPALITELGFDMSSGESMTLPTPPEGHIAYYTIEKTYQLISGEVLARSSNGDEEALRYAFQARCTQSIADDPYIIPCDGQSELSPTPEPTPTSQPTEPLPTETLPTEVPTPTPRVIILPTATSNILPTPQPTAMDTPTSAPPAPTDQPDQQPTPGGGIATPIGP